MRHFAPAFVVVVVVIAIALSGIGPSSAQNAGSGTPDPATACATPGALGSPEATPILVVEATPGVDPGEASPVVQIVCATPQAGTPVS